MTWIERVLAGAFIIGTVIALCAAIAHDDLCHDPNYRPGSYEASLPK
jgi:hypothetical protein